VANLVHKLALLHEGTNVLKVDLVKIRVPVQLEHVRTRVSGEMGEETKFRLNLAANCCVCFVDSGCWGVIVIKFGLVRAFVHVGESRDRHELGRARRREGKGGMGKHRSGGSPIRC